MAAHTSQLDHLVVTAPDLADGVAWLEAILGVPLQSGGEHDRMGTHNALLRLGSKTYLEVIAPNPRGQPPMRPRWFELDRLDRHARPGLAAWVARTVDIQSTMHDCNYQYGPAEEMDRGPFRWLITIPSDGALPGGGAVPMLIQWTVDSHPAEKLEDQGCSLKQLQVFSSQSNSVSQLVGCLGLDHPLEIHALPAGESSHLIAQIETPRGTKLLRARDD